MPPPPPPPPDWYDDDPDAPKWTPGSYPSPGAPRSPARNDLKAAGAEISAGVPFGTPTPPDATPPPVDTPLSPTEADDLLEREARAMLARGQPRDATNIAQTIEDEPRRAWLIEWIAFQVLPGHE